jgi:signal transduction histidine kinase
LQPKIFDRFERARASKNVDGRGLGRFSAKKIVEAHQGKIQVESEERKGTKFLVELPLPGPKIKVIGLKIRLVIIQRLSIFLS